MSERQKRWPSIPFDGDEHRRDQGYLQKVFQPGERDFSGGEEAVEFRIEQRSE